MLNSVNTTIGPSRGVRPCAAPKSTAGPSSVPLALPTIDLTPSAGEDPAHSSPESPQRTSPPPKKKKGKQPTEDLTRKRKWDDEARDAHFEVQ